jgi:hypothetical protein
VDPTEKETIMSKVTVKYVLLSFLQLWVFSVPQRAHAAKPTPPPPPPSTTTILFDTGVNLGTDAWYREARGINPDGTGAKLAFQHRFEEHPPVPTARVYGTDNVLSRYWLVIDTVTVNYNGKDYSAKELFACRLDEAGDVQRIQISAFFPHLSFVVGAGYVTRLSWSNDGNDSFIAFFGRTYGADGDTLLTPSGERDLSDDRNHVFKVALSGLDLQLLFDAGIEPKFTIDDVSAGEMIQPVLTSNAPADGNMYDLAFFDWSPDGSKLVYHMRDGIWIANLQASLQENRAVVHETDTAERSLLINAIFSFPRWSPDGTRIAFSENGYIRTIRTDGTDLKTVLSTTANDRFGVPIWSPDSQFLAVNHRRISKGFNWLYDLSRVPASGGNYTVLYKGDVYGEKRPVGWYKNLSP